VFIDTDIVYISWCKPTLVVSTVGEVNFG